MKRSRSHPASPAAFALLLGLCAGPAFAGPAEDAAAAAEARRRYEEAVRNACSNVDGNINVVESQRDMITNTARSIKEVSPEVRGAWDAMTEVYTNIDTANGAVNAARQLINPNANLNNAQYLVQDSRKDMFSVSEMLKMNAQEVFGFIPPPGWNGVMPGEKPIDRLDPSGVTPSNNPNPGASWTLGTFPAFATPGGAGWQPPGGGTPPGGGPGVQKTGALEGGVPGRIQKEDAKNVLAGGPVAAKGDAKSGTAAGSAKGQPIAGNPSLERKDSKEPASQGEGKPEAKGGGSSTPSKGSSESWQTREAWEFNQKGDYRAAERSARAALLVDPKDSKALEALAWAQLRQGKYKDAEASATEAIALDSRSARAYRIRAFARQMLGDRKGMIEDIERAAKLDPDYAEEAEIARRGGDIYDPSKGDDEIWGKKRRSRFPWKFLLLLSAAGAGGLFARRQWLKARRSPVGASPTAPPAAPAPAKPSAFTLEKELSDKHGLVFLARDKALDRTAILRKRSVPDPERRRKALESARKAASFSHPSSVKIYEAAEDGDWVSIVYEHVTGPTLINLITSGEQLGIARSVEILSAVSGAVEAAHAAGVVHGNLHLGNIFLSEAGEVKVADFGTAPEGALPEADVEALGRCLSELAGASGEAVPPRLLDLFSRSVYGTEPVVKTASEFLKVLKG